MVRLLDQCPCCPGVVNVARLHVGSLCSDEHRIDSPERCGVAARNESRVNLGLDLGCQLLEVAAQELRRTSSKRWTVGESAQRSRWLRRTQFTRLTPSW